MMRELSALPAAAAKRSRLRMLCVVTIPLVALPIACATIPPLTLQIEAESTRLSAADPTQIGAHGTVVHAYVSGGSPEYAFFWTVKDPMGQVHNELLDDPNGSDPTFHPGQLIGPYLLTCTVKDGGVGLVSDSIIIYASQDLGLSLSVNRKEVPSGGGVNGQVEVKGEVWGGSPPYTYKWNAVGPNGEPADDRLSGGGNTSRLFASADELGTYRISCTVTDATGAMFLQATEIVVSHLLSINISSNRPIVTPGGGLTGLSTLTAEVSGGKAPYTYRWTVVGPDGLEGQWLDGSITSRTLFTSPALTGTYRVVCTAQDATGGQVVGSMLVLVSQQLSVSVTTNRQRISSDGGPSGQATLKAFVIGGSSSYTYKWTVMDPDGQDVTDLLNDRTSVSPVFTGGSSAGTYQILCEVIDAVGQVTVDSLEVVVGQPLSLEVTVNSSRAASEGGIVDSKSEWVSSGGGADGQATVTAEAIGGSPPYAYTWSIVGPDGQPAPDRLSGSSPNTRFFHSAAIIGTYTVFGTVVDATGMTLNDSVKIVVYDHLTIELLIDHMQMPANGGPSGTAHMQAVVAGGTPPYTYAWTVTGPDGTEDNARLDDPTAATPVFTSGALSGIYRADCIVEDSVGQTQQNMLLLMVGQPVTLDVVLDRTDVLAAGGQAHLYADARGGIPPYQYSWVVTNPAGAIENERLDDTQIATPTFTSSLMTGTFSFTCTVTDASGFISTLSTSLVVGGGLDQGLSVSVTTNHEALPASGSQASLYAAALGGVWPLTYEWVVLNPDGSTNNTALSDAAIPNPTFTAPGVMGTYRISCSVTDVVLKRFTDSIQVYVGMPLAVDVGLDRVSIPAAGGQAALSAAVSGGVAPYTYAWTALNPTGGNAAATLSSTVGASPTFTAPATAGTYRFTCTVTDAAGTTAAHSVQIYVGMGLSLDLTAARQSLPSGQTSGLNAFAQGGIAPYAYAWNVLDPSGADAATSLNATNVANPTFTAPATGGTYRATCTVTDAAGETFAQSLHLVVGMPLTVDVQTDKITLAATGNVAALIGAAHGGVSPYTYAWTATNPSGGNAAATLSSTAVAGPSFTAPAGVGTYRFTCTVTDVAGVTATASLEVYVGMGLSLDVSTVKQSLPSAETTVVTGSVQGGAAPYTYAWSVLSPSGADASASLSATNVANPTFTGPVAAGTYRLSCTVTDAASATVTQTIHLYVGMPLTLTARTDKVGIPATGGQAALLAAANGGAPPYTYAWTALNPTGGDAAATLSSTAVAGPTFTAPATVGTYRLICTVTDAAGTIVAHSMQIYVGMRLSLDVTAVKQSLPSGQTSGLNAFAQGGIAPYTYAWSVLDPSGADAATSLSATNVANPTFTAPATAGTYRATCTVTDAAGETFAQSLHLVVGMPLTVDVQTDRVTLAAAGNTAALSGVAHGGASPYTYTWTALNPSGGNAAATLSSTAVAGPTFTAPAAVGTYRFTCTATDAAGVTAAASLELYVGMGLSLDVATVRQSLPVGQTTAVTASAQGGAAPYTYAWSALDPSGADASASLSATNVANPTFTALASVGTYRVTCTATDAASATATQTIHLYVGMPLTLTANTDKLGIPATGAQAALPAIANGGAPPYTYAWTALNPTGGDAAAALSNIAVAAPTFTAPATAGTYRFACTVTDTAGTTAGCSLQVYVGMGLSLDVAAATQSLPSGHTSGLNAAAQGGIAPYTYSWSVLDPSAGDAGASLSATNVFNPTFTAPGAAGTYRATCTLTDAASETTSATVHLLVGMPLSLDVIAAKAAIPATGGTTAITATASGGTTPYTYAWTATDPSGASAAVALSSTTADSPTFTAPAAAGTYRFGCTVTDAAGATFHDSTSIWVGMNLSLDVTAVKQSLPSGQTTAVTASSQGGLAPHTYAWSVLSPSGADASASLSATNVASPTFTAPATAGTYRLTCTVTDAASETLKRSVLINVGTPVSIDVTAQYASIPAATGQTFLFASVLGGVPGYTYSWGAVDQIGGPANGAINDLAIATPTFTAPATGTYHVFCTVTDAAGATSFDSCTIQVGVPLSAYLLTTRNSLVATHTATLSATASGGTAPYAYAWTVLNPSGADVTGAVLSGAAVASPTFTAPAASGVYRVTCTITDARAAAFTNSIHLSVGMPLAVDVTTTKMTLGSAGTATLAANASGGATPYAYAWTVRDSTGTAVPTSLSSATAASPTFIAPATSGTYRVTCVVTDNEGQTFSDSVHILVGMSLSLAVTTDKSILAATGTASLGAVPIGGAPSYTYSWLVLDPLNTDVTVTTLDNESLQDPTFTAPVLGGTYRVSCTVMDSASVTFASTVNIYVTTRVLTLTNPAAADASNAPTSIMGSTPLTNQYAVLAVGGGSGVDLPYARNLQVRFNDPNGGIWASFYLAVDGVDANGDFQTEMFLFTNPSSGTPAGGTTVTGTKTFSRVDYVRWIRNVTSITPSGDERVMIGVGDVFGLPTQLSSASSVRQVTLLPATNLATPADYTVVTTPGSQGVSFTGNPLTRPDGTRSYTIYYDED